MAHNLYSGFAIQNHLHGQPQLSAEWYCNVIIP